MTNLDLPAVRRGALGVLMFVAPAYILAKLLSGGTDDSFAWMLLLAALVFGTAFGGYVSARERPPTPMTHGAFAAGCGLGIVLVAALLAQALRGHLTLGAALIALVLLQLGTALGCLGGLLAAKGVRP